MFRKPSTYRQCARRYEICIATGFSRWSSALARADRAASQEERRAHNRLGSEARGDPRSPEGAPGSSHGRKPVDRAAKINIWSPKGAIERNLSVCATRSSLSPPGLLGFRDARSRRACPRLLPIAATRLRASENRPATRPGNRIRLKQQQPTARQVNR